jgi:hypothetical protein
VTPLSSAAPLTSDGRERVGTVRLAVLAAAFLISGALLAVAERMAAGGDRTAHFYVFWFAYFLVMAPVAWLLVSSRTRSGLRSALVVALGVWTMLPKLVRSGAMPLYHDEFVHLRMLQDLVRVGHPVSSPALLQIGASFPGIEILTSAVTHLSGLSLWTAAVAVASIAHVAMLAGVYVLVKEASGKSKAGGIAVLIYSLNPSWLVFDSQYSYETLALPMLVWGLVFALRAMRTPASGTTRGRFVLEVFLAAFFSAALVVTHHVTSVISCAMLLMIAVIVELRRRNGLTLDRPESSHVAWGLAAWAVVVTALRFVAVGHPLLAYLAPAWHLNEQFHQLLSRLGLATSLPNRAAFAGASLPTFEIICGFAMLPILLVAFVWGGWGLLGQRRKLSALHLAAAALGALFFVSLLLVTTVQFSEEVHRSWAFSYLGMAVVVGTATASALDGTLLITVRSHTLWPLPVPARRWAAVGAAVCTGIVAIGGVALSTSVAYRFGGPVSAGNDVAAYGTQTKMVANWFAKHTGSRDVVFSDRFVALPIATSSPVVIAEPSELWALVLSPQFNSDNLKSFLEKRVTYLVIDRRIGSMGVPVAWSWYTSYRIDVPLSYRGGAYVGRFRCLNWANAVYATSDYQVFKVDTAKVADAVSNGGNGFVKGCSVGGAS